MAKWSRCRTFRRRQGWCGFLRAGEPSLPSRRRPLIHSGWIRVGRRRDRDGGWPRLGGSGNNTTTTSFWLDDLSYLRLKNFQIGYSLPGKWIKKLAMTNLRIAGSAENLLTFTTFRGLDPEKAGNNNNLYPLNKTYSLSIQVGF